MTEFPASIQRVNKILYNLVQLEPLNLGKLPEQWRIQRGPPTAPVFKNPMKMNLVSVRPNYFIFMGYLRRKR